jgi:hypothetical protein
VDGWRFRELVPTFRQNDFRQALARSGNRAMRRLATEEWPMLCAIWRRDVVSPDEYGAALVKALSTTNSLSRLVLHAHANAGRGWHDLSGEGRLIDLVAGSVQNRVEASSDETFFEHHGQKRNYSLSAAKFHEALTAHVRTAPRPLSPLILWAVRRVVFTAKGRQFGLSGALREEDGIQLSRPHFVEHYTPAHPPLPDGARSPSEWIIERLPCPFKEAEQLQPLLEWAHEGVLCQAHAKRFGSVTAERYLRVLWCDTRTARWGLATNVIELLEQASDVRMLKNEECGYIRIGGHAYLVSRWQTMHIEADGTLTEHERLPPGDARWDTLVACGNGVLFADNRTARLRYWDAATDSLVDLANHASTAPGPLNSQRRWQVLGLHPGPLPGQCDVMVQLSGQVALHVRVNCSTREIEVVHTIEHQHYRRFQAWSIAGPDAFYIPSYPLSGLIQPVWRRIPRDPSSPPLYLPETPGASSIAASERRLFANRTYGTMAQRHDLSLRDGFAEDSRVLTVKETRVSRPSLLRIGDDLVLIGRMANGIRIIRDAFTRELPHEGTEIQLYEVTVNPR